jgi:hypothetical protein
MLATVVYPKRALQVFLTLFFFFLVSIPALSQQRIQGFVEQGGFQYSGSSSARVQRSFTNATVTVYNAGTTTLSTIYSNGGMTISKSNPFTTDSTGYYYFYAANGRYDIKFSGTDITSPFTLSDILVTNIINSPATTTTLGLVTLSVAPANPAIPVVVGANDPKLNFLGNFTKANLFALSSPRQGDFAQVTDNEKGFWYYTGSVWKQSNGYVDIKDFGAKGDGSTNDAPAMGLAMDFLRTTGGGTLFIPSGDFKFTSTVNKDLTNSVIKIQGTAGKSQIMVATGVSANVWTFSNAENLKFEDLVFTGNPSVANDVANVISCTLCQNVIFERVDFYGVCNSVGSSLVYLNHCNLYWKNSNFYGSTANTATFGALVYSDNWIGIHVDGMDMKDFGAYKGVFHSKTAFGPTYAFYVSVPNAVDNNFTSTQTAEFRNIRIDEGASSAITASVDRAMGKSIRFLKVENSGGNIGNIGNSFLQLTGVDNVEVNGLQVGYSTLGGNIADLQDCGNVNLRNVSYTNNAGIIRIEQDFFVPTILNLFDASFSSIQAFGSAKTIGQYCKAGKCYFGQVVSMGTTPYATVDNNLTNTGSALAANILYVQYYIGSTGATLANLGTPANGNMIWCSDCNEVDPCTSGGNGSWAKRQNGRWKCN